MEGKPIGDEEAPGTRVEPAVEAPAAAPGSAVGRGLLPDGVKKALLAGVGALFMTEEGARRLAREWKLPKEVIGFVGQQAQGAKDEILRVLSDEVRRFLESEALHREFWKALSGMAIEVKAEIRLLPGEDGRPRPEVRATVRPRRARRKAKG